MNTVQVMRQRADQAGHLRSTPQQTVISQGQTIVIEPANPELVYVPRYDPWVVYGAPIVAYPGWYPFPELSIGGPEIAYGDSFGVGFLGGFGWGWHNWGFDWRDRRVIYNHDVYISHSRTFVDRRHFAFDHGLRSGGGAPAFHGFAEAHGNPGTRSGVFGGFDHGGMARSFSSRGQSSFGGGFHAGGFHVGGFHGGGGHR